MAEIDWRRLPPLSALRAFEATARLSGFSAAARALNVTPAAVAQQVRALEADLRVTLVQRAGKGVVLTPAGAALADRVHRGFESIAAGVRDLRAREAARGLRVTTTNFITDALILPNMGSYWARHPGAEVAFSPGQCCLDITPAFFEEQQADVVIMTGHGAWADVEAEPLLTCPVKVVGTPDLCCKARRDLNAVPWIWGAEDAHMAEAVAEIGVDLKQVQTVDLGSPRLELSAVRNGAGMTLCSEIVAHADLETGVLEEVPFSKPIVTRYHVVTLPGPRRAPVQAFIDWLHELAAPWRARETHPADPVAMDF